MVSTPFFEGTLSPAESALLPSIPLSQLAYTPPANIDEFKGDELNERMFSDAEHVHTKHGMGIVVHAYLCLIALHNNLSLGEGDDDPWWNRLCGMHADSSFLKKLVFIVSGVLRDDNSLLLQFIKASSTFFPFSYLKRCSLAFVMVPNNVHDLFVAAREERRVKGALLASADFDRLHEDVFNRWQASMSAPLVPPPPQQSSSNNGPIPVRRETYYEVLGVDHDADEQQIERAFRAMAKTFHPDKNMGDAAEDASEIFKMINEGRAILTDGPSRSAYDRWLLNGKPSQEDKRFHQHPMFAPEQPETKRKQPTRPIRSSSRTKPPATKKQKAASAPPHPPSNEESDEQEAACTVCKEHTSEEDDHPVLFCDGCDEECHLRCTSPRLDAVPEGDWYCSRCVKQRMESSASVPAPMDEEENSSSSSDAGEANAPEVVEVEGTQEETIPSPPPAVSTSDGTPFSWTASSACGVTSSPLAEVTVPLPASASTSVSDGTASLGDVASRVGNGESADQSSLSNGAETLTSSPSASASSSPAAAEDPSASGATVDPNESGVASMRTEEEATPTPPLQSSSPPSHEEAAHSFSHASPAFPASMSVSDGLAPLCDVANRAGNGGSADQLPQRNRDEVFTSPSSISASSSQAADEDPSASDISGPAVSAVGPNADDVAGERKEEEAILTPPLQSAFTPSSEEDARSFSRASPAFHDEDPNRHDSIQSCEDDLRSGQLESSQQADVAMDFEAPCSFKGKCSSSCVRAHRDSYLLHVENSLLRALVRDLQATLSEQIAHDDVLQLDDYYPDEHAPPFAKCFF